ncbi:toxin-antitoxin system YwqK family antitoxin [Kordia sp.]|uniref:toxin-antitoxin system YwqK family antitoxin n=1 Tax=Kordia sp. TaxID=1965332 RepID=UPI003D2ACECF
MKKLLIIAVFFLSGTVAFAQNNKPTLEKKGDVIEATYFHNNGAVAQTGFFNKEGKLQGEWKSYDTNGKKVAVGNYENGKKVGKWFFWSANSLSEVDYSNSRIVGVNNWKNTNPVVSNK